MGKALLLSVLLVVTMVSACTPGRPEIMLETVRLDLGEVSNGEIVSLEVVVHNVGDGELSVHRVTTSCGCTRATLEPMSIPAGSSGKLQVEFDSGAHGPDLTGPLVRQIFLNSDDPRQPEAVIELAATVLPPARP